MSERSSSLIGAVKKYIFSVALDSGRAHFVCAVVHKYSFPLSRVRWFIMFEFDAIVYICTYCDPDSKYLLHANINCSVLLLPRCMNIIIGGIKHSLISSVCVFQIFLL